MTYDPPVGSTINDAIRKALRLAKRRKEVVSLKFNGSSYTVKPTSTADEVYFQFERMSGMYKSYFGKPFKKPRA